MLQDAGTGAEAYPPPGEELAAAARRSCEKLLLLPRAVRTDTVAARTSEPGSKGTPSSATDTATPEAEHSLVWLAVPRDCPGAAGSGLCRVGILFASFQTSVTPDEINYCLRCGSRLAEEERFGRAAPGLPGLRVDLLCRSEGCRGGAGGARRTTCSWCAGRMTRSAGAGRCRQASSMPARIRRRAAERECLEETGLVVQVTALLDVLFGQDHPAAPISSSSTKRIFFQVCCSPATMSTARPSSHAATCLPWHSPPPGVSSAPANSSTLRYPD